MKALQIVKYGEIKDSLAFNEVSKPTVQANDFLISSRFDLQDEKAKTATRRIRNVAFRIIWI